MTPRLADYHIHTSFCNHANGTMKQYVTRAISMGLVEMGFSDHNPLPARFNNHYRMLVEDMPLYLNIIEDLRKQFPEIRIKVGVEMDYIDSAVDFLRQFIENNHFDYIIGSVHYLNGQAKDHLLYFSDFNLTKKRDLFFRYFQNMKKAVQSGLFDIIGHFDIPRRFWGDLDDITMAYAEEALQLVKQNDLCLEINTSGFRTENVMEPFPGRKLLSLAQELQIPIIIGSDSHTPSHVGSYFRETVQLLKNIGFTETNFFSDRKRIPIPL